MDRFLESQAQHAKYNMKVKIMRYKNAKKLESLGVPQTLL